MLRACLAVVFLCFSPAWPGFAQTAAEAEFFEKKVRPALAKNCQGCHNPRMKMAKLDLSTAEGFAQGAESGPLFNKAEPGKSLLLRVTSYEDRLKMPPTGKLPDEQISDLREWVSMGAPWPGAKPSGASVQVRKPSRTFSEEERNYWAFQPLKDRQPPAVKDTAWARTPIDRFLLTRMEEKNLKPALLAGKLTLLRRVTYDLTGLPPTEKEMQDYLADDSTEAFAKVVDRLLASPRYGERWGRKWLDVARYADSTGNDEDHRYPHAWRYRDYIIEAFNNDLPFDQFIREQVAGDLLPPPAGSPVNRRGIIATGFLALGAKAIAQQDKKKMLYDVYDEQTDVVSKTFLGITLACARCHDHKFDPFSTKDYYSLVSIFASTRSFQDPEEHVSKLLFVPLVPKQTYETYQRHQEMIARNKAATDDLQEQERQRYNEQLAPRLAEYMLAARRAVSHTAGQNPALRPEILEKWVKYLGGDPRGRPHLEQWFQATDAGAKAAAMEYQARYQNQLAEWNKQIGKWREQVKRMLKEMNMPPPPRPVFDAGKDRFFHEVYFEKKGPFAIPDEEVQRILSAEAREELARLKNEADELKRTAPPEPDMACAVEEGEVVHQKVFIRGDYGSFGEDAPKGFPPILAGSGDPVVEKGSGRAELAEWLIRQPLTARVMVNRVWQGHFGEGLVRTVDNFGVTGERPTHPELLDYLAREFIGHGRSIKKLHRAILLTHAYQMTSEPSKENLEADPENRLLTRFNRRRLDVEEIRDAMLALDGAIDFTVGGSMQSGVGTDGENSQDRLSLNPEKAKRRTVYLPLRRANLPSLLNLYDFGDATTVNGKRGLTNVAPQALFMLNSEFLTERSKNLADAWRRDSSLNTTARVEKAYLQVLNRKATPEEVDRALSYIGGYQRRFASERAEAEAWQSFSRVLLASSEFIYVD